MSRFCFGSLNDRRLVSDERVFDHSLWLTKLQQSQIAYHSLSKESHSWDILFEWGKNQSCDFLIIQSAGSIIKSRQAIIQCAQICDSSTVAILGDIIDDSIRIQRPGIYGYFGLDQSFVFIDLRKIRHTYLEWGEANQDIVVDVMYDSSTKRDTCENTSKFITGFNIQKRHAFTDGWAIIESTIRYGFEVRRFDESIKDNLISINPRTCSSALSLRLLGFYPNASEYRDEMEIKYVEWYNRADAPPTIRLFDVMTQLPESKLTVTNVPLHNIINFGRFFTALMILSQHEFVANTAIFLVHQYSIELRFYEQLIKDWNGVDLFKFIMNMNCYKFYETSQEIIDGWESLLEFCGGPVKFKELWRSFQNLKIDHSLTHQHKVYPSTYLTYVNIGGVFRRPVRLDQYHVKDHFMDMVRQTTNNMVLVCGTDYLGDPYCNNDLQYHKY